MLQAKIEKYNRKIEESLQVLKEINMTWPKCAWAIEDIYKEIKKREKENILHEDFDEEKATNEYFYQKYCAYWTKIVTNNVPIDDKDDFWQYIAYLLEELYYQLYNHIYPDSEQE